jgi:hypothetical protein
MPDPDNLPRLSVRRQFETPGGIAFVVLVAAYLATGVWLMGKAGLTDPVRAARWFDPLFFQYNLALLMLAQLFVPAVTFMYVTRMRDEKAIRLRRELPHDVWEKNKHEILGRIVSHFRFGNYFGSALLLTLVISLGAMILLILKPEWTAGPPGGLASFGVDYTRGGNFLLLGPTIQQAPGTPEYTARLVLSLTAFQFGFLGGFVYFISQVVRAYFTLDLTPHTYVESVVRMVSASVFALVLSFGLEQTLAPAIVPLLAFAFGYFPDRALLLIDYLATKAVAWKTVEYQSTDLSKLRGMSLAHEVRLSREGFDNVENLAEADTLDLAVRTGFSYRQLRQWVGEAWLRVHLGDRYGAFVSSTAITTRHELQAYLSTLGGPTEIDAALGKIAAQSALPLTTLEGVVALVATYDGHVAPPPAPGPVGTTREATVGSRP